MQDDGAGSKAESRSRREEPGPGRALRAARQQQGLSREQVAQDMHLDVWIVEAMEQDDFAALGAPVFAKGYLRKYATLLGLSIDDLLVAYYRVQSKPQTPELVASRPPVVRSGRRRHTTVVLGLLLLLVAAAAAGLWWYAREGPPVSTVPRATQPAAAETQVPDTDAAELQAREPPAPAAALAETAPPGEVAAGTPPDAPGDAAVPREAPAVDSAAAGHVVLELRFAQDSWVEVYDAQGRRLMFGLEGAGSSRRAAGPGPLEVYLGNAAGVEVYVDGQRSSIPAGRRRGNVARFQVGVSAERTEPQT